MPSVVADVIVYVLYAFLALLFFRLVMEYVFMFRRSYRASGALAVLLEAAYTVTDPPLRALRRVLPPLRIGGVSLDLGFILLFIVTRILIGVFSGYR
ncbi:MAG TPA: YggT family protein [Mycobacteriales bacterium]|nr:YggT family protein [Mycobacteriales bacterium]